jgi:thiol-disulfide isomerase/thioredoxin
MNIVLRAALAGILGLVLSASPTTADGPKSPPIDPEAKARLDALIAAYRALPAYADHGEVSLVVKVGDRELKQVQKARIGFARPNRLDVRTDLVRVVSDGSNVTAVVSPLKKYLVAPAPKKFAESSLRGGPLGSIEFGGVAGLPLVHVLNLAIGDEPERLIYDFSPKVLAEADQVVDGVSYRVLRLDESDNHDWRFLIDPRSGLIAFVDLVVEGDATRSSIAGGDTHVESLRWSAGSVSTEVPGPDAFAFKPPTGFTQVGKLEGAAAAPRVEAQAHPMVGKPAPDFSLDVLDGPGKFRKVSRADLAGKVVLIDFWATWCGPCLKELPDVQKLIESYGQAGKEVVVLALSIDRAEAGDLNEARGKVEATLKEMKLTLAAEGANPVGLVALDPLGKVAEGYGVEAIPFVVLVDAKGVVRAVHVGLTAREVLAEEVDALLAGKPLAERK